MKVEPNELERVAKLRQQLEFIAKGPTRQNDAPIWDNFALHGQDAIQVAKEALETLSALAVLQQNEKTENLVKTNGWKIVEKIGQEPCIYAYPLGCDSEECLPCRARAVLSAVAQNDVTAGPFQPAGPNSNAPTPKCAHCGKPATCIGVYEYPESKPAYACDDCCGHGNEDGWCDPIDVPSLKSSPTNSPEAGRASAEGETPNKCVPNIDTQRLEEKG